MKLDFGIFDHLDRNDLALHDLYEQRLKVIELFDRFGFYAYHVAEHHFTPLGMAPSPSVFLSAVSQRTKRLRFGTFVYALPVHHPLRVLEEICMLDHMSGGRLEIGFGRGSVPFEIAYYGQNAQERQQIYAERLELILKAFAVGTLTWQGRYDRFENVPMEMAPLQKPHPPLWYGAHSADSAERAAQKGFNIVTNDAPGNARSIIDRFPPSLAVDAKLRCRAQDRLGTIYRRSRYRSRRADDSQARLFALAFEFCLSVGNAWCTAGFAAECGKLRPADWARTGHCWLGRHGSRFPSQANGD